MTMTPAALFNPVNPLAVILKGEGGVAAATLIVEAQTRVDTLVGDIRAFVEAQLAQIFEIVSDENRLRSNVERLAALSVQVAEVAGAAGLDAVGEAARGIVAMADHHRATGCWHEDGMTVHLHTLALLTRGSGSRTLENDELLARLQEMRRRIGITS